MKSSKLLSQGFSTLDALAALMVLNLICVGVLTMQLQALQAQRDALGMQAAVGLAQDLWERMHLFPQAAMHYQLQLGQVVTRLDCHTQACNPSQWAQSDLFAWQASAQGRLPGAQTQLVTLASGKVQLMLAWPSHDITPSEKALPSACPSRYRCWQTSWSL
jgi:Tfp pilus assembly protein PilV